MVTSVLLSYNYLLTLQARPPKYIFGFYRNFLVEGAVIKKEIISKRWVATMQCELGPSPDFVDLANNFNIKFSLIMYKLFRVCPSNDLDPSMIIFSK